MKVVIHIDEQAKWSTVFSNSKNLLAAADEPLTIKVVANGQAVLGIYDEVVRQGLTELNAKMDFEFCHNALATHKVAESEVTHFAKVVPSGVWAVLKYQQDGFLYLRP